MAKLSQKPYDVLVGTGLIVLATSLVYGSSLQNAFVAWDDPQLVYLNPLVITFSPRIFTSFDPELYAPIALLTFQIEHALFGFNPVVFHFDSLLLHTLNALLVCWFLFLLTQRRWLALGCALLFAVHPLNVEAVAWVSARKELFCALFALASLICYILSLARPETRRAKIFLPYEFRTLWWLSFAFFFLALLSKVTAAMLPFVFLLLDWRLRRGVGWESVKEKRSFFLLAALAIAIAFIGKSGSVALLTPFQILLLALRSITFYLQKLFVPLHLSAIYQPPAALSLTAPFIWFSLLILLALGAMVWWLRRTHRDLILGAGMFMLFLLPTFLVYQKSNDIVLAADRYAYLPSVGWVMAVGALVAFIRNRSAQTGIAGILAVVTLWFATLANAQSLVWHDTATLFNAVLEQYPTSHVAYNNLGFVALDRGLIDEALALATEAVRLKPDYVDAYVNLGAAYGRKEEYDEAEQVLRRALELNPRDAQAHFNLGGVAQMRGQLADAVISYEMSIEIQPSADAYFQLAKVYLRLGQRTQALDVYRSAIALKASLRSASAELESLAGP